MAVIIFPEISDPAHLYPSRAALLGQEHLGLYSATHYLEGSLAFQQEPMVLGQRRTVTEMRKWTRSRMSNRFSSVQFSNNILSTQVL